MEQEYGNDSGHQTNADDKEKEDDSDEENDLEDEE